MSNYPRMSNATLHLQNLKKNDKNQIVFVGIQVTKNEKHPVLYQQIFKCPVYNTRKVKPTVFI